MLLGLLASNNGWVIKSNAESGIGYSDIFIEESLQKVGCVIEMKYAKEGDFEEACEAAMAQITDKKYTEKLWQDGMKTIHQYRVACYRKECKVVCFGG